MLSFQIKEIEDARLSDADEEEQLTARKKMIRNSEKIVEGLTAGYQALSGDENSTGIDELFDSLTHGIGIAAKYIDQLEPMAERLTEMKYELSDISSEIRSYFDDFEFNPREADEIESRLDTIYKLKRKYGATIAEIVDFGERAAEELESITQSGERAEKLNVQLKIARDKANGLAKAISNKRLQAAEKFMGAVEDELSFLDMPSVKLSVSHSEKSMAASGIDNIEFMIVTNIGEQPKPLSKIASGGEISRIMLAIKNVLADRDKIDTLIFDEVDTGVSGRAAQKIGRKLKQVASSRQVICVTHLAQVAAFADNHLLIRKQVEDGRTFTKVSTLTREFAIEELARITSGDLITESSLKSAEELWEHSHGVR